jgi:hypothetical protein
LKDLGERVQRITRGRIFGGISAFDAFNAVEIGGTGSNWDFLHRCSGMACSERIGSAEVSRFDGVEALITRNVKRRDITALVLGACMES